ncbi:Carboxylesterase NlhH [Bremerella volcania]|uniref:Carboxylesterase NlhH n=1 Tax=Bremerella volcania TaxID=2527984 RepID=A0A518C3H7_9BACT|nr:alpha/beta hydrolase fold domain-containing protein [Bremerella volcania]QDU73777.1 Carboxylesterase NlhH [Bremerella volcania]
MNCSARLLSVLGCLFLAGPLFAQAPSFDRLDRNSDGKIEKDELPERAQQLFGRLDSDSDGSVTQAEFEAFEKRRAQMQRQRQGQRPQANDNVAGVEIKRDIPYGDEKINRQKLDVAVPEKPSTDKPLPVIVLIHGGGWQGGTHGPYLSRAIPLVRTGDYAAVSIGYRLTDVASWPAQIHDCQAGLRWVKANAEKYNWDPDKIVVWGSSAGGHLVAMLGVSADVKELDGKLGPHADQSLKVAGVVDFFGPANMLTMGDGPGFERHNSPDSPESKLLGGPAKENVEVAKSASPQFHVSKGDAPFLILHGTADGTVPFQQSVDFHEALTKAGVDSTFVPVKGAGHGFAGQEVNERVEAFLSKILLGKEVELSDDPIESAQRPQPRRPQGSRSE